MGEASALFLEYKFLLLWPFRGEIKGDLWQTVFEQYSSSWLLILKVWKKLTISQVSMATMSHMTEKEQKAEKDQPSFRS